VAGGGLQAGEPLAAVSKGVDADNGAEIEDGTGRLRRVTADHDFAGLVEAWFAKPGAGQVLPVEHLLVLFVQRDVWLGIGVDEEVGLGLEIGNCGIEKIPVRLRNIIDRFRRIGFQGGIAPEPKPEQAVLTCAPCFQHHDFVIAAQGDQLDATLKVQQVVDHPFGVRPPIDVVTEHHQGVVGSELKRVCQRSERKTTAVNISNRKDSHVFVVGWGFSFAFWFTFTLRVAVRVALRDGGNMSVDEKMNKPGSSRKSPPNQADGIERLKAVVHDLRSPGGCPWDIEQTHESLVTNLIEEAYEAVDAIRSGDKAHMREELGDLLLQVVMHAEIASETDSFDLDAVAHDVSEKLIRRHPHVYGDSDASTTEGVLAQWDAIKQVEKGSPKRSLLHGVGKGLPALSRAAKLQKKVGKVGFDWPDTDGVIAKIREELDEVVEALDGNEDRQRYEEEIGDLLFSVANLARKLGSDPEVLLAATNEKFMSRFAAVEQALEASGKTVDRATLDEMETAWQAAKR
jgi:MazG family protein